MRQVESAARRVDHVRLGWPLASRDGVHQAASASEIAAHDLVDAVIRAALLNALVEQARSVLGQDWRAAEPLIEQALHIDGGHPLAKSLQGLVLDYKRQEILNDCVSQVREMQANGDLHGALAKLEEVLALYPNEVRLVQLRKTLQNMSAESSGTATPATPQPEASADSLKPNEPPPPVETVSAGETRPTAAGTPFTVDHSMVGVPAAPIPGQSDGLGRYLDHGRRSRGRRPPNRRCHHQGGNQARTAITHPHPRNVQSHSTARQNSQIMARLLIIIQAQFFTSLVPFWSRSLFIQAAVGRSRNQLLLPAPDHGVPPTPAWVALNRYVTSTPGDSIEVPQ